MPEVKKSNKEKPISISGKSKRKELDEFGAFECTEC